MSAERIRVVKMSGAGNDFLVLTAGEANRIEGALTEWVSRVCRRGLSAGADGVLIVDQVAADRIGVRFHNPDGSRAFCGNGSRCAARYAQLRGLAGANMVLETEAGEIHAEVSDDTVRLTLPPPTDAGPVSLDCAGETVDGRWIHAGSPHCVVRVDDPAEAPLERWGPTVRRHPHFGDAGVNLDVASWNAERVDLRTWERGVEGETLACGSGAVAAAFAARLQGAPGRLRVVPASGIELEVHFTGPPEAPLTTLLVGDARVILEGELSSEATSGFGAG